MSSYNLSVEILRKEKQDPIEKCSKSSRVKKKNKQIILEDRVSMTLTETEILALVWRTFVSYFFEIMML